MGHPSRQQVLGRFDRSLEDLWALGGLPLPMQRESGGGRLALQTHHSTAMEGNTLVSGRSRRCWSKGARSGTRSYASTLRSRDTETPRSGSMRMRFAATGAKTRPSNSSRSQRSDRFTNSRCRRFGVASLTPTSTRGGPGGFRRCEIHPLRPGLNVAPQADVAPCLSDWLAEANAGPTDGVTSSTTWHVYTPDSNASIRSATATGASADYLSTFYSSVKARHPLSSTRRHTRSTQADSRARTSAMTGHWQKSSLEPFGTVWTGTCSRLLQDPCGWYRLGHLSLATSRASRCLVQPSETPSRGAAQRPVLLDAAGWRTT